MAFYGCKFLFDGIPCEAFDLMMYDVNGSANTDTTFASPGSIEEETVGTRWKPYFYGVTYKSKLSFNIAFGVNQRRLDDGKYLSRDELDAISTWLTGHDQYKWLEIEQPDMEYVRYKCMIQGLTASNSGLVPWTLIATVICDSPFAYLYPQTFKYNVSGTSGNETTIVFNNESSFNGYYYPKVSIHLNSGNGISIVNTSDGNREFKFENIPGSITEINVDNENMVITNNQDLNIYPCFNYKFLRLVRGYNILKVVGNGFITFECEFPVNIGG